MVHLSIGTTTNYITKMIQNIDCPIFLAQNDELRNEKMVKSQELRVN